MSGRARRLPGPLLAALLLALSSLPLLTACGGVGMPTHGDVVEAGPAPQPTRVPGISIEPRPPQHGASPTEIVQGFLDAMLATPTQTRSAQQFLTKSARTSWDPAQATLVYGEKGVPRGGSTDVGVELSDAYRLDARGAWRGPVPETGRRLAFRLAREGGEWRIASAPNALIVPVSWYQARFVQLSLYFFDPSGRVLVPEPVFVPRGNQLATTLVRDLVAGPPPDLAGVVRSFLPPGVGEGLSVPVENGTADIALTAGPDEPAQPTAQALTLLTAQLGWTLRQDPTVQSIRLSVGGRAVQLPGGRSKFSVSDGPEYDPAGYQTSPQMFGLDQHGRLVSGQPPRLTPVPGAFGARPAGLRVVAVDLDGERAAGVTSSGTEVRVAPVRGGDTVTTVATGTDLLRPAWDVAGRLWIVDRGPDGAQVSYIGGGGNRHPVTVPGISGTNVVRFLVARDGTRLVAVRRDEGGDRVMVSRLRSDDDGAIASATPASQISPAETAPMRIKDIAWASPTTVLLLHRLSEVTQLRPISVDGSSAAFPAQPIVVTDSVDGLLSSPVTDQGAYGVFGTQMRGLTGDSRDSVLDAPVTSLGFVG